MDIMDCNGQNDWSAISSLLSDGNDFFPKYVGKDEVQKMAEAQHERISEKRPPPKKVNFDSFFGDAFDSFDSIYQKPSGG